MNNLVVCSLFMLVLIPLITNAYAETENVPTPFGLKIKFFIQDVSEFLERNDIKKAELKIKHADENQMEIERLVETGDVIPVELETKRKDKILQAEKIIENFEKSTEKVTANANENSVSEDVINRVRMAVHTIDKIGEINEIAISVNEFKRLQNESMSEDEKDKLAEKIDTRINKLQSVRENCGVMIDSKRLAEMDNPYSALQEQCPSLQKISKTRALSFLGL